VSVQRRTDRLAGLATEAAYAKAARFLSDLTGIRVSPRTIRNDVVAISGYRHHRVTRVPGPESAYRRTRTRRLEFIESGL
jgi:hypothetical protein